MATKTKISLLGLTVYTVVMGILLVGVGTATSIVLSKTNLSPELITIAAALDSALVVIALTLALEMRISQVPLKKAIRLVGLKAPANGQIKIALIGLGPLALAYILIFAGLEIPADTVPGFGGILLRFLIAQGLAEEIVFRGFVFRHLRATDSFLRAAMISALLFSLIHFANFMQGFTPQILMAVTLSVVFGFILTFPLSRLFEFGRGSIVAGVILHIGIDSVNWFEQATTTAMGLSLYLLGILGTAIAVLLGASSTKERSSRIAKTN